MNENKILHIMIMEKFLAPFINFIDENFGREEHHYIFVTSEKYQYSLTPEHKVEFLYTDEDIFITLLKYMKISKKIILHGLWRDKIDILLYFNQDILKKCYWIMWGADYYFPEKQTWFRHQVIKNMGNFVSYIKEEYHLIKKLYGSNGKYVECFSYPSNLFNDFNIKPKINNSTIYIQIGNSADPNNNHIEILEKISIYKNENIKIFVPLSYGDKNYAKIVIKKGKEFFGKKFTPFTEFMPYEDYLEFLINIDIAIFAHKRQQAIGNTINLIGLGKKVYINPETNQYKFFTQHKINIFNINNFNLEKISSLNALKNKDKINSIFSKENLRNSLKKIFS